MSTEYAFDSLADQQLSRHYLYLEDCEARFHDRLLAVQVEDVAEACLDSLPEVIAPLVEATKADRSLTSEEKDHVFWMLLTCVEQALEECRRREASRLSVED